MIARRYGITPGAGDAGPSSLPGLGRSTALAPPRLAILYGLLSLLLIVLIGQTLRLATGSPEETRLARAEPVARSFARPDIVDRRGVLVATDVELYALAADPALMVDTDEASERIATLFPDVDAAQLRRALSDRQRRYLAIRRGLTPLMAQRAHDLGIPGLIIRAEPARTYPQGATLRHLVGRVDDDNRGVSGIERHLDSAGLSDPVAAPMRSRRPPVRLSVDVGVQHAVGETLARAIERYGAKAASGLVLDVETLEVVAAVSIGAAGEAGGSEDLVTGGVYELGSVAKVFTLAMALDELEMPANRILDTREPLRIGAHTITDTAPAGRPLTLTEVLVRSSNVGVARIAIEAGAARQRAFLDRLGLLETWEIESGPIARPLAPARWGEIETVTISYGHGLAVAPLQLAAAAAALVNGGIRMRPTLLAREGPPAGEARVVSEATSAALRALLRLAVTDPNATGRRAAVEGFEVGGKTGTAEMPGEGGYRRRAVIASFLAIVPVERPRYLVLTSLHEPATGEIEGRITAGLNAAPTTARIIERIAPMLGLLPARLTAAVP